MGKFLLLILILFGSILKILGQDKQEQIVLSKPVDSIPNYKNAVSILLYKHMLSIDYERTVYRNFGMAISTGYNGVELEAKVHFKPQIKSSSIGFSSGYCWFPGSSEYKKPLRISMLFIEYRAKKRFTFMAGAGWYDYKDKIKARYRAGVGMYFPW